MSGAQDTAAGKDINEQEQQERCAVWAGASDTAAATTLLEAVTSDPLLVLISVKNAETLIANHA